MFDVKKIVKSFDEFLTKKSLKFSVVIIGGSALNLIDVISRNTRDVDCLLNEIPEEILSAAKEFAEIHSLDENWLNCGPASITRDLPKGWNNKIEIIFKGESLELFTLCRLDLIRSKVWALCDRGIDLDDCVALNPSSDELETVRLWLSPLDGNEGWPEHVSTVTESLGKRLGHGQ